MIAKILGILTILGIILSGIWAYAERSYFSRIKGELIADSQIKSFKAIQKRLENIEDAHKEIEAKEKKRLQEKNKELERKLREAENRRLRRRPQ